MVVFPNCKINLGLNILSKRIDGYHNLETIFYPIPFTDIIEINRKTDKKLPIAFSTSGMPFGGEYNNNLCIKAFDLVKKDYPSIPSINLHLHKAIPLGAGLGGGSADAVFTLQLLNKQFALQISPSQMDKYALALGSDCPFFILNKPSFASGRGELLEPISLLLRDYKLLLVCPGVHIETALAFREIIPVRPIRQVKEIIEQPIENWKDQLTNDFEHYAFKKFPVLKDIKGQLYNTGAAYASMSGSGSTIYGIYSKDREIQTDFPPSYLVKELSLN